MYEILLHHQFITTATKGKGAAGMWPGSDCQSLSARLEARVVFPFRGGKAAGNVRSLRKTRYASVVSVENRGRMTPVSLVLFFYFSRRKCRLFFSPSTW